MPEFSSLYNTEPRGAGDADPTRISLCPNPQEQIPLHNTNFSFSVLQYINQRKKHRERWVGALMSTSVPCEYQSILFLGEIFGNCPFSLPASGYSELNSSFSAGITFTAGSPEKLRSFSSPKSCKQGKILGLEAELDPIQSCFVQGSTGSFPSFV